MSNKWQKANFFNPTWMSCQKGDPYPGPDCYIDDGLIPTVHKRPFKDYQIK